MGRVYIIADTHFGDEKILRYENRPFDSVRKMDEFLIARWNEIVREEDTVFVLGDFSVGTDGTDREILSLLPGNKVLIMGNHDQQRTPSQWLGLGFSEISRWPIIYDGYYIFSHEPVYVCSNMPYANIFGHVHANPAFKDFSAQSYCVSVERTAYAPLLFEEVKQRMRG